ncbi:MAG: hypothetical protein NW241_04290 [Bacteroidia bacterium]|nr:hypothetical protein [Bacteroidia bacterium]
MPDYRVHIDKPLPGPERIRRHRDFGGLYATYRAEMRLHFWRNLYRNPRVFAGVAVLAAVVLLVFEASEPPAVPAAAPAAGYDTAAPVWAPATGLPWLSGPDSVQMLAPGAWAHAPLPDTSGLLLRLSGPGGAREPLRQAWAYDTAARRWMPVLPQQVQDTLLTVRKQEAPAQPAARLRRPERPFGVRLRNAADFPQFRRFRTTYWVWTPGSGTQDPWTSGLIAPAGPVWEDVQVKDLGNGTYQLTFYRPDAAGGLKATRVAAQPVFEAATPEAAEAWYQQQLAAWEAAAQPAAPAADTLRSVRTRLRWQLPEGVWLYVIPD